MGYTDYDYASCKLEAKYIAMGEYVSQLLWIMHTLVNYELEYRNVKVLCDNISTINLTKDTMYQFKIKHIEVKHHFIIDHMSRGDIEFNHVESKFNLVDIFTKLLRK